MPVNTPFGADAAYKLKGLKIKFARHHTLSYSNAHKKLQQTYGGTISEIDDLWTDADRTSLSPNAAKIIRRKISTEIYCSSKQTDRKNSTHRY